MVRFVRLLINDIQSDSDRGRLVRSTGASLALKVGSTGLAFLASLIYARALGPRDYGQFAYVITCTTLASIPVALGLPQFLVREGARSPASTRWLLAWADRKVLVSGLIAGLLLASAALIPAVAGARWMFVIAAPLPLLLSLTGIRQSLLQAKGWIARSQWPQMILVPVLVLIALVAVWIARGTLRPWELMLATVVAAIIPVLINGRQLRRAATDGHTEPAVRPELLSSFAFMWLAGLQLLQSRTDLLMLGAFAGAREAGIYAIASRAAELLLIVGLAANTAAAPRIAFLAHARDHAQLQQLLSAMSRRVVLSTLPLALILILFAEPLLRLLYGAEFAAGAGILQMLALAQLVAVMGGPLGILLNMSGHERLHLLGIGLGLGFNVLLGLLLIPRYGALGAAAGMCASLVFSRVFLLILVRRRLGLRATVFGI